MDTLNQEIQSGRYLLLEGDNCPLTREELKTVELLFDELKFESITSGDAGDKHKLQVGRFRRDVDMPSDLHASSSKLMEIINSDKMKQLYSQLTGYASVCIRRAQANILNKGDYVGIHIDGIGDPKYKGTHIDYKYAVVLHFGSTYEGGDTLLYPQEKCKSIRLPEYSMFIITGDLPHEVEPVKCGTRKTIAYFLSDNFGPSKK